MSSAQPLWGRPSLSLAFFFHKVLLALPHLHWIQICLPKIYGKIAVNGNTCTGASAGLLFQPFCCCFFFFFNFTLWKLMKPLFYNAHGSLFFCKLCAHVNVWQMLMDQRYVTFKVTVRKIFKPHFLPLLVANFFLLHSFICFFPFFSFIRSTHSMSVHSVITSLYCNICC